MHYSLEQYALNSPLNKYNSLFKMGLSFLAIIFVMLCQKIEVSIFVLTSSAFINVLAGKIKFGEYLKLNSVPFYFMVFAALAIALDISFSKPLTYYINIFGLYIFASKENLFKAVKITLNAEAILNAVYFTSLSTPVWEITHALKRLKIPKDIVFIMDMTYRFIFVLYETWNKMNISSKSRMGEINFISKIRSFGYKSSSLFLLSLSKADEYYNALLSRGYNKNNEFYNENKSVDKKLIIFSLAYFLCLVAVYLLGGIYFG